MQILDLYRFFPFINFLSQFRVGLVRRLLRRWGIGQNTSFFQLNWRNFLSLLVRNLKVPTVLRTMVLKLILLVNFRGRILTAEILRILVLLSQFTFKLLLIIVIIGYRIQDFILDILRNHVLGFFLRSFIAETARILQWMVVIIVIEIEFLLILFIKFISFRGDKSLVGFLHWLKEFFLRS